MVGTRVLIHQVLSLKQHQVLEVVIELHKQDKWFKIICIQLNSIKNNKYFKMEMKSFNFQLKAKSINNKVQY